MESPVGRPVAVEVIDEALRLGEAALADGYVGLSREMQVYWALKKAGYLTEAAMIPNS